MSRLVEFAQNAFEQMMLSVGTCVPAHIVAFEPETQLAQVQVAVAREDADGAAIVPAVLIECPVFMLGGTHSFAVEARVAPGDQGLAFFSQRSIDAWRAEGGVAAPPARRFHDMSDALFLPGFRSVNNALPDFQNDGIRLRNADGTQYVWLRGNGDVEIKAGAVTVDASDLTVNGISAVHHSHAFSYSWTGSAGSAVGTTEEPTS